MSSGIDRTLTSAPDGEESGVWETGDCEGHSRAIRAITTLSDTCFLMGAEAGTFF